MTNKKTTKDKKPLVSIIIPVYNGSNYLKYAIDSALAQTYDNIEVIVVNDGSTDNGKTARIAKSYGNSIQYIEKPNGGVSTAINLGIKKMHGEYFSWLSHDDAFLPNKTEVQISYLKEHNLLDKKVIAYSDYQVIDRRSRALQNIILNEKLTTKHQNYAFLRCVMSGISMLIPKSAWDTYGELDEQLKCTQDYEKWFEMNETYRFVHVPKVLVQSRYHPGQVTNTSPLVRTEGNTLWVKVLKSFTEKDRIKLNGDNYTFYYYFIEHLKKTPYDKALAYCEKEIKKYQAPSGPIPPENLIDYELAEKLFSKNPIIKIFQFINREGVVNTLRRIKIKIGKITRGSNEIKT